MLFDDAAIERFVAEKYPHVYPVYMGINGARRVQRYDLFRFLAVYHYGGWYFDTDVELVRPLTPLLNSSAVFPHGILHALRFCFGQDEVNNSPP